MTTARCSAIQAHHAIPFVRRGRRESQLNSAGSLSEFHRSAVAEQSRASNCLRKRYEELGVGPIEDVDVDAIAAAGRDAPGSRSNRAAARTVDALAILPQPLPDFSERLCIFRLQLPSRQRTGIQ